MHTALRLLAVSLILGWSAGGHAQDGEDVEDIDQRLDSLKSDLLDVTPGFYVSPLLSGAFLAGSLESDGLEFDFDGYLLRGGAAVGYQVESVRFDLQAALGTAEFDVDAFADNIDVTTFDVTVNGYYDIPVDLAAYIHGGLPAVMPYVGAGLGWVYLDADDFGSDGGVLTQGFAGLGIRVSPRWTVDAGYRYIYVPRLETGGVDNEIDAHSAELKLRYRF